MTSNVNGNFGSFGGGGGGGTAALWPGRRYRRIWQRQRRR
jgi:hypothetical protein